MKNLLSLKFDEAKEFLLKNESYINLELPTYINFERLLKKLSSELKMGSYKSVKNKNPDSLEAINYKLLHNKDGKYEWRPLELIHPVLYVSLVHEITKYSNWKKIKKRFGIIRGRSVVQCMSLPIVSETKKSDKAEQILNWWQEIEQNSLILSLEYEYIYHTDIANCYGSIYTHSIPWAIHTKKLAKSNLGRGRKGKNLIGNIIDEHIRAMSYGQTNGIPQGSVLMDFIAEMVLNYADLMLSKKISKMYKNNEFKIIRYRDDYRIFVNNPTIAENIIKKLSEVLIELGLKLHAKKTLNYNNVIQGSIKTDKIEWLMCNRSTTTVQKKLLILHKFSDEYKNSGTLTKELQNIYKELNKKTINTAELEKFLIIENIYVLISIVTDIAYHNPRTYSISSAILSRLFCLIKDNNEALLAIDKVFNKIRKIPNTGHMQIWLQRAVIKIKSINTSSFEENICKLVNGEKVSLWNNEWLPKKKYVDGIFKKIPIINDDEIEKLEYVIKDKEVLLFINTYP